MADLVLSALGHTWFLDLDGTLLRHNGHLTEEGDTLLPGALDLVAQIPAGDLVVIVTSRDATHRPATAAFLAENGVRYDHIIFGAPYGERIVVNDAKPSGLQTAMSVNVSRDQGPQMTVTVDASR